MRRVASVHGRPGVSMRWGPTVTDTSSEHLNPALSRRAALLGAAGLAAGLAVGGSGADAFAATTKARAKKGGNLRIGVPGNGVKDIIDGQNILTKADQARQQAGWETLLTFDRNYKLQSDGLAESVEPSGKLAYTIRLRKGLEFHNGKSVTADDVIYSLKRLTTKKLALDGGTGVTSVDPTKLKKMDNLTVRVGLHQPDSTIPFGLASYTAGIVPVGYASKGTSVKTGQIGTGPFMLESFDPGKQSVHKRFANYWRGGGLPYLDQVTVIDLDDDTARINALIAGQIDVMTDVPFAETKLITGQSSLVLFENAGAGWLPLCMRIDQKPFTDVRVRQAFRLIVDRPAMLEQAIAGHGRIANDLYSAFDPAFLQAAPAHAGHREGEVAPQGRRAGEAHDRPADERAGRRHERDVQGVRAAGEGSGRDREREGARLDDLQQRLPEVDVLARLLGDALLPAAGRPGLARRRPVQRDALAPEGLEVRVLVPAGARLGERRRAHRDRAQDDAHGVRVGRLHHPVQQQPGGRVLEEGHGLPEEPRYAQSRLVRPQLHRGLVHLNRSC